jgi:hypothetical protein
MQVISRQEAISKKLKTYFTGKPCKRGHISERLINCMCLECKKENRNRYKKNNLEKLKKYNREYSKKNYSTEKRKLSYQNNIESELYHHAKQRAKEKNLEFNIKKEDITIPLFCPVFGTPISFDKKENHPTLDRIDNNKGYTKENIMVISFKANRLKNNGSIEDFKKIICYIESQTKGLKNA